MIAQQQAEVVLGPLEHDRFGKALVVRPTVETARAHRHPSQAVVVTAVARRLIELSKEGEKIQAIVVEGGTQDPTCHPEFHEISENIRDLQNKHFPKAKLYLLSDVPHLELAQTRHALSFYDQPMVRLEAGTQKTFCAMTGKDAKVFKDVVELLPRLGNERLIVQAEFVRGDIDNSKDNEVRAWIRHLTSIKPAGVHITTPAKPKDKKQKPITKTRISQIAEMVTTKTGIPVEVVGN